MKIIKEELRMEKEQETIKLLKEYNQEHIIKLLENIIVYISDKTLKKEGKSSLLSTIIAAVCQTNISINIEIIKYLLFFNEY